MSKRNRFSVKQYDEVKNNSYTVIAFNMETGERAYSYSSLSMYDAVKDLQQLQIVGRLGMLLTEEQARVVHSYEDRHKITRISYTKALELLNKIKAYESKCAETEKAFV